MCGIVGTIALTDEVHYNARQHFLKYALIMDTIRGADSTGIINVSKKFSVQQSRTTMAGNAFVATKGYKNVAKDGWCTIGHNRAATAGSVKVANAHPFRFGPITLVHNGTLYKAGSSLPTFDSKLEVDSMQIALALSLCEPGEADGVLEQIDGAFALVWTDERDRSINMARNANRPLHFAINNAKSLLTFMSDGHMLTTILKSFGTDPARGNTVYSIDTMKHLKFKKGSLAPEVTSFRPFIRPQAPAYNKPSGTTGKPTAGTTLKSATQKAREKWGKQSQRVGSGIGSTADQVIINGKLRGIPEPMLTALETYMELDMKDRLEFMPMQDWQTSKHGRMVEGVVNLPHWGDAEWDAIIQDVPEAECNAYWDSEWTVQPVGITRPLDPKSNYPALLCKLIKCDWEGDPVVVEKGECKEVIPLVKGVGGRFTTMASLKTQLEGGCINCGKELVVEKIGMYEEVNIGVDIICEECVFVQGGK